MKTKSLANHNSKELKREDMNPSLDDEFEYVELRGLSESTEQKLRYLAAKAGVPLKLYLGSLLSQEIAKLDGDTVGDYRYSDQPD
jgi:hypothetical protein